MPFSSLPGFALPPALLEGDYASDWIDSGRVVTEAHFAPMWARKICRWTLGIEVMLEEDAPDWYCAEVLTGLIPVRKLIETDSVLGFVPPKPLFFPEHVIVIPKRHVRSLLQLEDPALTLDLLVVIKQLAQGITARHGGCQVFTNLGDYQHNRHLHWHLARGEGTSSFPRAKA